MLKKERKKLLDYCNKYEICVDTVKKYISIKLSVCKKQGRLP